jgi:hypothetical protein
MKRFSILSTIVLFAFVVQLQAQLFTRTAEIKEKSGIEVGGFGNIIAGVDFDKDGRPEIYAVNTNAVDRPDELIPRIYKFELNPATGKWDEVWSATAPIATQNTWPALAWGDTDKDGRPEIYWGIVNATVPAIGGTYQDVPRILVFEYPGDGSDNMGVADGLGGFMPNASTNILPYVPLAPLNIRPVRFIITDIDNDGKDELIFSDRASNVMNVGVLSVDVIPNNGGGTEKWTVEYSGQNNAAFAGTSTKYDIAILGNVIYLFDGATSSTANGGGGKVFGIKYANGAWQTPKLQLGIAGGNASFKGSKVVDINKDGTKEILCAEWNGNGKGQGARVWLLRQVADTLTSTEIANVESLGAVRLNGADAGDIDGNGKLDFIFGSRSETNNTRRKALFRLEYQGGDIALSSSYTTSVIDSAYGTKTGDLDIVVLANVDGDIDHEIIYTQGYPRQDATNDRMPIIILDKKFTPVSVRQEGEAIPTEFYLSQNYPNPFNPSTEIKFGITTSSNVTLKIFDILGKEIATIIDNQFLTPGSYVSKFDAKNLSSGVYIYTLSTGSGSLSKKMQLLK